LRRFQQGKGVKELRNLRGQPIIRVSPELLLAYKKLANEYRKGAVTGASPLKLVVMLYDGALRFMEAGKHAMAAKNLEKQNAELQKAQRIVTELMACLDMEHGGEIAQNLFALYSYVLNELVQANINDEPEGVDRAIAVMSELRMSWVELETTLAPSEQADAA
jgi:flagellar secretion chaperone FliS